MAHASVFVFCYMNVIYLTRPFGTYVFCCPMAISDSNKVEADVSNPGLVELFIWSQEYLDKEVRV